MTRYLVTVSVHVCADSQADAIACTAVTDLTADDYGAVLQHVESSAVEAPIRAQWAPVSVRDAFAAAQIDSGRVVAVGGRLWATDGHVAVAVGPTVQPDSLDTETFAAWLLDVPPRPVVRRITNGGQTFLGLARVDVRYVDLVERCYPGCTWRSNAHNSAVAAILDGAVVALVMPQVMRIDSPRTARVTR